MGKIELSRKDFFEMYYVIEKILYIAHREGRLRWECGQKVWDSLRDPEGGSYVLKVRQGGYIPFFVNAYKRSEAALVSLVQEAYINGVST